jgi:hypothetical protein
MERLYSVIKFRVYILRTITYKYHYLRVSNNIAVSKFITILRSPV